MSFTALQNTPITIDLTQQAKTTGWSVSNGIASHEICNSGYITLLSYTLTPGVQYNVSYVVLSISSGYVQLFAGSTGGIQRTTIGFYTETITSNGTALSFFSNGNCSIQAFNIRTTQNSVNNFNQNTIVYSAETKKWLFRTIAPDCGGSLYIDMLTIFNGNLYIHKNGSDDRNVFYGVPYQSIIQYVDNAAPTISRTYQSISIQSNQLIVTTAQGISTSLGHVSELADVDFNFDILNDGVSNVAVNTKEGFFAANFLRDINSGGLESGDILRGNWLLIELISTANTPLRIYSINITSQHSSIGSR
jgi:hypothetical protein